VKVFIWVDPYPVNYGSSLLFAVAETVEQARSEASYGTQCHYGEPDRPQGDMTRLALVLKEPDRILDLPCAEWHEWSE